MNSIENAMNLIEKYLIIHEISSEIEYRNASWGHSPSKSGHEFIVYLDFGIFNEVEIKNELETLISYAMDEDFIVSVILIDDAAF
jgi:hypothetical protein